MNLDPIDIFGETFFEPVKRVFIYASGLTVGGWIGEISINVDRGQYWSAFGFEEFAEGFVLPFAMLFSSGGPLIIAGLIFFVMTSARLRWFWFASAAGASALAIADRNVDTGWICWAALNAGLAGSIWLYGCYRQNEWAHGLFELNTRNSMRRAMRNRDAQGDDPSDEESGDMPDGSSDDPPKIG